MSTLLDATSGPQWYTDLANGDSFPDYGFFGNRSTTLNSLSTHSQLVLVCGCGVGWLVKHLTDLGFTAAWGCDNSSWCQTQAGILVPSVSARILAGDCLSATSMTAVKTTLGVNRNGKIAVGVTDDLLTCCASDAEVASMLAVLRGACTTLIHIIWPYDPTQPAGTYMPGFLWHTWPEWQALIGPTEHVIDGITGAMIQ